MGFLQRIKDLVTPEVPPKCPCCRQEEIPLERIGPIRFACAVCSKDFDAVRDGEDWRFDLRPLRHVRRLSA